MTPEFAVSDFVAVFNQTIEVTYPHVIVVGELANFKISKNRWLYFDIKDDFASIRCFGNISQLPGPIEDGMMLRLYVQPRLHPQFGFSLQVQVIELSGEGTIKKAAKLLEAKLEKEGLFAPERKRILPYPPASIGLITSGESAAYADFIKIMNQRWSGVEIRHIDVQVQGENAPAQIAAALEYFNSHSDAPEVLVVTRGGGSADDLQAFSTESVTRAVAASRVPTLVAIGHEVDTSLAERAADVRASTPSNAAELLVPDKRHEMVIVNQSAKMLGDAALSVISAVQEQLQENRQTFAQVVDDVIKEARMQLREKTALLRILSPEAALQRGYALVKHGDQFVGIKSRLKVDDDITILLQAQELRATIIETKGRKAT